MFRLLARWLKTPTTGPSAPPGDYDTVFQFHPMQLQRYLEQAWAVGGFTPSVPLVTSGQGVYLGDQGIVPALALPKDLLATLPSGIGAPPAPAPGSSPAPYYDPTIGSQPPGLGIGQKQPWEHLIYAYLIENTGVIPIFRRVLELYSSGEQLETPSLQTRMWLRNTEDLFFRDPPAFQINSVSSFARPDLEASRRNAYWRMFGMDLNHGGPDGRPYPYGRGAGGNADFVPQWESFLQEVWQGYINRSNSSGENYSDPEAVANRAETLAQVMQVRRQFGNLAREEFFFTAMMSWFHLTVEWDTPVVVDLKATASSPAERLRKIGLRVGIEPHPKSRSFFEMADPASVLMRFVELGSFNDAATADVLYNNVVNNTVREDALVVINHWSIATGRDLKLRRPAEKTGRRPAPRPPAPRPVPGAGSAGVMTNGASFVAREHEFAGNGHGA